MGDKKTFRGRRWLWDEVQDRRQLARVIDRERRSWRRGAKCHLANAVAREHEGTARIKEGCSRVSIADS